MEVVLRRGCDVAVSEKRSQARGRDRLLELVGPGLQDDVGHGVSHFEIGHSEFVKAVCLLERANSKRRGEDFRDRSRHVIR